MDCKLKMIGNFAKSCNIMWCSWHIVFRFWLNLFHFSSHFAQKRRKTPYGRYNELNKYKLQGSLKGNEYCSRRKAWYLLKHYKLFLCWLVARILVNAKGNRKIRCYDVFHCSLLFCSSKTHPINMSTPNFQPS